jgi:hypothetical protein
MLCVYKVEYSFSESSVIRFSVDVVYMCVVMSHVCGHLPGVSSKIIFRYSRDVNFRRA